MLTCFPVGEETPPWPITGGQSSPVEMLCKLFILSEDEGLNPNIEDPDYSGINHHYALLKTLSGTPDYHQVVR